MRKEIVNPETGEWADHETAYSDTVVVHLPESKRAYISGVAAEGPDLETQTRNVLEKIEGILDDFGGTMEDVVRVRVYMNKPTMDEDTLEVVHGVRQEFFVQGHLPSSTLVEVEDLVSDEFLIEIDADAIIPDDEWTVESR